MGLFIWLISALLLVLPKRVVMPGRPGGLFATLTLSMIGALIGGYIASYFELGSLATLHVGALGMAIAGSLLMLLVVAKLRILVGGEMSLENAPDDVKLAVDLIQLLEEHQLPVETVLSALAMVQSDFENKRDRRRQLSRGRSGSG